jgi:ATP diphosphatase
MIGRHPHVFGPAGRLGAGAAAQQWEELKQAEGGGDRRSVVDGRLPALPALTAAYRVQEKAAAVGFDWEDLRGVLDKIDQEVAELREEMDRAAPDAPAAGDPRRAELGDLLFAMVNLARRLRIDPESALRATTARFMRRFRYIEERLAETGTRPSQTSLAEMDRLWEARPQERSPEPAAGSS